MQYFIFRNGGCYIALRALAVMDYEEYRFFQKRSEYVGMGGDHQAWSFTAQEPLAMNTLTVVPHNQR
jgi:hypothetical protein